MAKHNKKTLGIWLQSSTSALPDVWFCLICYVFCPQRTKKKISKHKLNQLLIIKFTSPSHHTVFKQTAWYSLANSRPMFIC